MNSLAIRQASSQIGVKEIKGDQHNKTIVSYSHDIGLMWINDDETPWCAIFVYWVLMKCGYAYQAKANARSFENYGIGVDDPEPGDIVVFWRESPMSGKGHVGFFLGFTEDGKYVYVLGGNQGNQVGIGKYSLTNLVGYRRILGQVDSLEVPNPPLQVGSKGIEVGKLQNILRFLDLNVHKTDNDFGGLTKQSVILFQKRYGFPETGVYDSPMKNKLFSLLNQ